MTSERRMLGRQVAIEDRADGSKAIVGYAAVYYREGDPGTEFRAGEQMVERIHPGAFDAVLAGEGDIVADFEHRPDTMLGRRSNGTLKLSVDSTGLKYEVPFDQTDPDHQRVAAKITRGDVRGSSFSFQVNRDGVEWRGNIRNIKRFAKLSSVGPVTDPAYPGTSASCRDIETAMAELRESQEEIDRVDVAVTLAKINSA